MARVKKDVEEDKEKIFKCSSCRYMEKTDEYSVCARHPPYPYVAEDGVVYGVWPPVENEDGCGDWAAKLNG